MAKNLTSIVNSSAAVSIPEEVTLISNVVSNLAKNIANVDNKKDASEVDYIQENLYYFL